MIPHDLLNFVLKINNQKEKIIKSLTLKFNSDGYVHEYTFFFHEIIN